MSTDDGPLPSAHLHVRERPGLRGAVDSLVGYSQHGMTPGIHHGLPSTSLTLIFTIGGPLRTAADRSGWQKGELSEDRVLLGGLHTRSAYVEQPTSWAGIQIGLHPLATRALLGVPTSAIPVDAYDACDLLGPACSVVHERLQEATTWPERFGLVEEFLGRRLARADRQRAPRPEIGEAWRQIRGSRGSRPIGRISADVGLGRRQLAKVFAAETGVTPKTVARLSRFEHARSLVQRRAISGGRLDISEIAHACGYFDHAHLVRDFREFADITPTNWAREVAKIQAPVSTDARG